MEIAQPAITIIMPVLNEAAAIRASLSSILSQDYPADCLEILVVDGGSTDGTRKVVQEILCHRPLARLLDNPRRIQAAALNIGILAAQGEIIVRVDGHTILAPNYVSQCVNYLVQGKADNVGGLMRPMGTTYVGQGVALATSSPFGVGNSKFHYSDQEQYVDTVYLGAYWRKTFKEIGLYDPAVHINEDYELNYRLRQAGGKILLSPAIESTYTPRSSLAALWRQYFVYGRQKIRTLQKFPESLNWRQAIPPLFVLTVFSSLLSGIFWKSAFWLFGLVVGCYLLANIVASIMVAAHSRWRYLPVLPLIFVTLHFAWGLGFWFGLLISKPFEAMEKELLLSANLPYLRRRPLSVQLADHKSILVIIDGLLVLAALLLGLWLGAQRSGWTFSLTLILDYSLWFAGLTTLYFILATINDSYKPKVAADPVASFVALVKTVLQIFIVYLVIYALLPPFSLPRHFVGFFTVISPFLLLGWRRLYSLAFAFPVFQRRAIIVGAGWAGQTIVKIIQDFAPAHFEVVGFVDDDSVKQQTTFQNVPVIGTTVDLPTLAQKKAATDVVLAINRNVKGDVLASVLTCYEHGARVSTMSELYERLTDRVPVEHTGDNWFVVLPLENNGQNLFYGIIKRLFDIMISIIGLIIVTPLLLLLALIIKLDSPGPIFYRQKRLGQAGKEFELIKLRSMIIDAEVDGQAKWAEKYDMRVTKTGLFLRRTRLDELPQLLNVLAGDMSLIGPRPERPEFVAQLQQEIPFYRTRLTVKPGLTGWAQVNYDYGRSVSDALEKLRYDLYYIKHQSLQMDLVILLKTVSTILLLKGT